MSALYPPFNAPREFIGTVDATRERITPTPRTLEQCIGQQRSSWAIVRLACDPIVHEPSTLADRVLDRLVLPIAFFSLVVLICAERLA